LVGGSLAIVDHIRGLEVGIVVYSRFPGYVCGLGTVDGVGAFEVGAAESSEFKAVCATESVCDTAVMCVSFEILYLIFVN
jgi:hypothetical protein